MLDFSTKIESELKILLTENSYMEFKFCIS